MAKRTTKALGIHEGKNGPALYVQAKHSGIDTLCAMFDGLPFTMFGRSKEPWYTVEAALNWHVTELPFTRDSKRKKQRESVIRIFTEALRQFRETGTVHIDPDFVQAKA